MKRRIFRLILVAGVLATVHPVQARDTKYLLPIKAALEVKDAEEKLDGSVKFYFGNQETPKIASKLGTDVSIPAMTVLEEKKIFGCVYGGASVRRDFPRLISLIEHGKLDVGAMVTRTMHLHEVNDAIKAMQDGEVIRSVLVND